MATTLTDFSQRCCLSYNHPFLSSVWNIHMYFHPEKLHLIPDNPAYFQNFSEIVHRTLEILFCICVLVSLQVLCRLQNHIRSYELPLSHHLCSGILSLNLCIFIFGIGGRYCLKNCLLENLDCHLHFVLYSICIHIASPIWAVQNIPAMLNQCTFRYHSV